MRQCPSPEAIVIETSGISNPAEIARALLDPVIFRAASLDTIVTLVDLQRLLDAPDLMDDSLWRAQVRAADFLLLTKKDLVPEGDCDRLKKDLRAYKPDSLIFEAEHGGVPLDVLFGRGFGADRRMDLVPLSVPQFESTNWTSSNPLSIDRFQNIVGRLASKALRIKGLLTFVEAPQETMVFQCVGSRATLAKSPVTLKAGRSAEIVFVARQDALDAEEIKQILASVELSSKRRN
jgi:cobalamin biosynthesis protein CobW